MNSARKPLKSGFFVFQRAQAGKAESCRKKSISP
jgi:hypothetical protein